MKKLLLCALAVIPLLLAACGSDPSTLDETTLLIVAETPKSTLRYYYESVRVRDDSKSIETVSNSRSNEMYNNFYGRIIIPEA